jgi:hypothetical protein
MSALEARPPGLFSRLFRGCGCCGGMLLFGALGALAATLLVLDSCEGMPSTHRSPAPPQLSAKLPRFGAASSNAEIAAPPDGNAPAVEGAIAEARSCILRGELSRAGERLRPLASRSMEATLLLALVEDRLGNPQTTEQLLRGIEDRSQRARELLRFID